MMITATAKQLVKIDKKVSEMFGMTSIEDRIKIYKFCFVLTVLGAMFLVWNFYDVNSDLKNMMEYLDK